MNTQTDSNTTDKFETSFVDNTFTFRGKPVVALEGELADAKGFKVNEKGDLIKTVRTPFKLPLPFLTNHGGLTAITHDSKVRALALELLNKVIALAAREQVDSKPDDFSWTPEGLDLSKLDIAYIAALPPSEKKGGITKEKWAEFKADYIKVCIAAGLSPKQAEMGAIAFGDDKLVQYRAAKDHLAKLEIRLHDWFLSSDKQDELASCYSFLTNRIAAYLAAGELSTLDAF